MSIETVVINGTSPTSTGNQSYTSSGFGTPDAVMMIVSHANGTNNPAADAIIGQGWADGTNQNSVSFREEDNQGTTDNDRFQSTTKICELMNDTTTELAATWNAWVTDGVQLNWGTVDASLQYNFTLVLMKGLTNVHIGNFTVPNTNLIDITAPGFKPNLVLFISAMEASIGRSNHAFHSFGAAHNNSSDVVTQACVAYTSVNNQAATNAGAIARDGECSANLYGSLDLSSGKASAFDSSGFSYQVTGNAYTEYVFYMAIDTGDTDGVDVSIVDSPTTTGTWNVEAPAFEPQLVMLGLTPCTAVDTLLNADPMNIGLSVFDDTTEFCAAIDTDDAAGTTDTQSNASTANAVQLYEFGGTTHDLMFEGSFTSFDSLGYNLSFPTTVDGTTRKWLSVAIKKAAAAGGTIIPQVVHNMKQQGIL